MTQSREDFLEYAEKLLETFATPGWKLVVEEAKRQIYQLQADALDQKSWENVCRLQGEAAQLSRIVNLEDTIVLMVQQAKEDEDDETVVGI